MAQGECFPQLTPDADRQDHDATPTREGLMDPKYLTQQEVEQLEAAMNTDDLEYMVATVDEMVRKRVAPRTRPARPPAAS